MSESGLEKEIIVDINPYQTRVVLLEQVYRGYQILSGGKYHK